MLVQTTLKPGQPGTKRLVARFGKRVVCVRYRYDPRTGKRYKTVELIVREQAPRSRKPLLADWVYVRVGYEETELREKVKAAGGRWNVERKLWKLPVKEVVALGLERRVVQERK